MAKAQLLKSKDGYYLYKVGDYKELWHGKMGVENSYRAGYVMDADNFEMAIQSAEEEMRSLVEDFKKYG